MRKRWLMFSFLVPDMVIESAKVQIASSLEHQLPKMKYEPLMTLAHKLEVFTSNL